MDHELPAETRARILAVATRHPQVRQVHELRTRSSGAQKFIQMHVVLDGGLTLLDAHGICDGIECTLAAEFRGADIIIHAGPAGVSERNAPVGSALG